MDTRKKIVKDAKTTEINKNSIAMKKKKDLTTFSCHTCSKQFTNKYLLKSHEKTHCTASVFPCRLCSYTGCNKKYLAKHVKVSHGNPTVKCDYCSKMFHYRSKMVSHMLVHTGEKPYKCQQCGKAFNSTYSLSTHMYIHTEEKPFECSFCSYACRDSSTLRKHHDKHMGLEKLYQCKMCPKRYKAKYHLKTHVAEKHLSLDVRKYACQLCDMRFKERSHLTVHVQSIHEKSNRCACEICGKRVSKRNISTHMRTHVDARPYVCTYRGCDKNYKDSSSLAKHSVLHYPDRQFPCEICGKLFSRELRLKAHLQQHLPKVKDLECDHCGACFFNKNYLSQHIRRKHSGKGQRYECDLCGFVTPNKPSIVMHIKRGHASEQDRECKICYSKFKRHQYLKSHYMRTHGVRYKTIPRKAMAVIKEEPDEESIDLFEIEKEELLDVWNIDELESNETYLDTNTVNRNLMSTEVKSLDVVVEEVTPVDVAAEEVTPVYVAAEVTPIDMQVEVMSVDKASEEVKSIQVAVEVLPIDVAAEVTSLDVAAEKVSSIDVAVEVTSIDEAAKVSSIDVAVEVTSIDEAAKVSSIDEAAEVTSIDAAEQAAVSKDEVSNARNIIKKNSKQLKKVPEAVFDDFFIEHVLQKPEERRERKTKEHIDKKSDDYVKKGVKKLLVEVRQNEQAKTLERARQMYNERMRIAVSEVPKKDIIKIKYFNNNLPKEHKIESDNKVQEKTDADDNEGKSNNGKDKNIDKTETDDDGERVKNDSEKYKNEDKTDIFDDDKAVKSDSENGKDGDYDGFNEENDDDSDSEKEKAEIIINKGRNKKLKLNTHQCYICFKLYETKEKLIDHCKDHFDVCNDITLKKCPLCDYVTELNITRHMRLVHNVHFKVPYGKIQDKVTNTDTSRYYYDIKDSEVTKMEIIPSVRNLNKIASTKLDKKNRELKQKIVAKTKLIKKGSEWIVEKEKVDVNLEDLILPEFNADVLKRVKNSDIRNKTDDYIERMKKLYHIAKKEGKKIMFPCENCNKICLTLAALKLHTRKHNPNAKPFKKKIWKHKLKEIPVKITRTVKVNTNNRIAKPKPITNKHKCDPELKEFYEKNITGGDVQFWQFLKIYNKMGRENIKDFKDLEGRIDFGIHNIETDEFKDTQPKKSSASHSKTEIDEVFNETTFRTINNERIGPNKVKINKLIGSSKNKVYKRVLRISKLDYIRRNAIKGELREKIAKEKREI